MDFFSSYGWFGNVELRNASGLKGRFGRQGADGGAFVWWSSPAEEEEEEEERKTICRSSRPEEDWSSSFTTCTPRRSRREAIRCSAPRSFTRMQLRQKDGGVDRQHPQGGSKGCRRGQEPQREHVAVQVRTWRRGQGAGPMSSLRLSRALAHSWRRVVYLTPPPCPSRDANRSAVSSSLQ